MKNYNLLVSTSRYNEENARAELWFILLMCGDEYPIIFHPDLSGLFTAYTNLDTRKVISQIKSLFSRDRELVRYILKFVPIEFVCETDLTIINQIVKANYGTYINKGEKFRIRIKKRNNEHVKRDKYVKKVAENLHNPVDLEEPEKIIRLEIIGNVCGISFLKPGDIIKPKSKAS